MKCAWDTDGSKEKAPRYHAATRLPDLKVHICGTTSIDVRNAGIDKAYGMRRPTSILDLSNPDVLFPRRQARRGRQRLPG
jgi:hypothetical protein